MKIAGHGGHGVLIVLTFLLVVASAAASPAALANWNSELRMSTPPPRIKTNSITNRTNASTASNAPPGGSIAPKNAHSVVQPSKTTKTNTHNKPPSRKTYLIVLAFMSLAIAVVCGAFCLVRRKSSKPMSESESRASSRLRSPSYAGEDFEHLMYEFSCYEIGSASSGSSIDTESSTTQPSGAQLVLHQSTQVTQLPCRKIQTLAAPQLPESRRSSAWSVDETRGSASEHSVVPAAHSHRPKVDNSLSIFNNFSMEDRSTMASLAAGEHEL